jgi:hypothetical protein
MTLASAFPARADMASAEALFEEARELFNAGEIAKACSKFAESQRLDPSPGTLLNLARCHREQGKTASAWAEYLAAKRAAETEGRADLVKEAARQADALRPTLSTMTLTMQSPPMDLYSRQPTRRAQQLEQFQTARSQPHGCGSLSVAPQAKQRAMRGNCWQTGQTRSTCP